MILRIDMKRYQSNLVSVICLHIVKWVNSSIWIDEILAGTSTPIPSGPGSNENKVVFHIP